MSKIVQAVNAMISNPKLITDVTTVGHEIFFLYKKKYVWSMKKGDEADFYLWYYPGATLDAIVNIAYQDYWEEVPMVVYKTSEIGTREARASFAELYTQLSEAQFGMNDVLDDIIFDEEPPF